MLVFCVSKNVCTLERTHERVIGYVFCALCMVCLDRAVSWHRQDYNRQSMQRVQNQGRSQDFSKGGAEVMETKAL